jgi:UDP-N-acetyl-D-mannosaminuronic acid transferase (WecB/TagA/CpsF family)
VLYWQWLLCAILSAIFNWDWYQFPGMEVAGTYSPPFRPLTEEEDNEIVRMINNSEADVIWVGLGAPNVESTTSTNTTLMGRT